MKNNILLISLIIFALSIIGYKLFFHKSNPPIEKIDIKSDDKGEEIYDGIYLKFENNTRILSSTNKNVAFTIEGENQSNSTLYYEIVLDNEQNNYPNNELSFDLIEVSDNSDAKGNISIDRYNTIDNRIIYSSKIDGLSKIKKGYELSVSSDNGNYDDIIVNIDVNLEEQALPKNGRDTFLDSINNHPGTTWNDSDNIIYLSGDDNAVNYNYVWYSGKLWRIMAVNPDGTMKLITDNMMTTIAWGINIEYNGSWAYQWLNEDFYDTLYNAKNLIVHDAIWNYTTDGKRIPSKPDTLPNQKNVAAPVGLISSYEYYVASKNNNGNYLDIHHRFWHITPQHDKAVRSTFEDGKQDLYDRHPGNYERAIRPVIYLNKYVEFIGNGTKTDPYRIIGDIKDANYGNDLLNTRVSGEYVLFDNDVYRIIDIFDNNAKIMRVDYLRNGNKGMELHIARTIYFGSPSNQQTSEWWDYYLNNIWYPSISEKYRNMVVDGIYYLGEYPDYTNYKKTICTDANLDIVRTKDCDKYEKDRIYIGKVGLSRIGEMFCAQQMDYEIEPLEMWTITPYDNIENRIVHESNSLWRHKTWGGFHVVHPTLYLNENVKITGGDGTFASPFTISE